MEKIVFATMDFMELLINVINAILLVENAMVQGKVIVWLALTLAMTLKMDFVLEICHVQLVCS